MPLNRRIQIGSKIGNSTSGSILFADSNTTLSQDNTELFWDNTNNRLGIGTTAPQARLEIETDSASEIGAQIMMAASQTADALQIIDSAGIERFVVTFDGGVDILVDQTKTLDVSVIGLHIGGNVTIDNTSGSIIGVRSDSTITFTMLPGFGLTGIFFQYIPVFNCQAASTLWSFPMVYGNQYTANSDNAASSAINVFATYSDGPVYASINGGTWANTSTYKGFQSQFTVTGAGTTFGTRRGFIYSDTTGTGSIVTQVGLDIETLTKATNNYAIRTGASGEIRFGNKITLYNNIATVSNGVPSELATVDLTAQAAAIGATTIYTPAATGLFRISVYLQVTRAATTSSILGGATGVVITYNDGAGNVAQTVTMALNSTTGTVVTTAAGNTTTTNLNGDMTINARTGVAIQYAIGYTSVGATTMQYSVSMKVEAM